LASDIDVRLINANVPGADNIDWLRQKPSLVFSWSRAVFQPPRGYLLAAKRIGKLDEYAELVAAGIPVPFTRPLTPDLDAASDLFGEYVIAKPLDGYHGRGVRLVKATDMRGRFAEITLNGQLAMLAQRFVECETDDGKPVEYRVNLALEQPFCMMRRSWRDTFTDLIPWAIFAMALLHLVLMYTVFSAFGRFVMPMALESYEPIGDAGWRQVLTSDVMLPTLIALLLFGTFAIFLTRALAARALLAFGIGAVLSAIAQAKGWPYHVLPALSAAILLATFTLSQTIDRYLPISRSGHRLPVAVISATLMVLLYFQAALYTPPFYKQRQYEDSIGGILRHIVEQNAPHRTIMTLSPGIYPFWPMLNYVHGRMTMRFLTMWVVQGVYADCEDFPALYNAPDTMGDTEKFVFDAVSDDFANGQPDLLIVDTIPGMPRCQGKVFDYLEYFQQNKVFADAF